MIGRYWQEVGAFALLSVPLAIAQGSGYNSPQVYPSRMFHELHKRSIH